MKVREVITGVMVWKVFVLFLLWLPYNAHQKEVRRVEIETAVEIAVDEVVKELVRERVDDVE